MEMEHLVQRLEENGRAIVALTTAVSDEQARWKPTPQHWSLLEVITHLYDEERLDFRLRLDLLLHQPEETWPPIDPEGWVTARSYNSRQLADSRSQFAQERQHSLAWLRGLQNPAWHQTKQQPWGNLSAKQFAYNWLAHDQLHIRQLAQLHHQWAERQAGTGMVDYAGGW